MMSRPTCIPSIVAALVFALLAIPSFVIAAEGESIHHVSAEVCANCHQDIYKQWKGSMHANSTALKDPIHGTFYQMVVGSPTEEGVLHKASGKYPICLQCHAPNAAIDKTTKLDAMAAYSEGVNCVACHTLKSYKGIQGKDGKLHSASMPMRSLTPYSPPRASTTASASSHQPVTTSSAAPDWPTARKSRTHTSASRLSMKAKRFQPWPWKPTHA